MQRTMVSHDVRSTSKPSTYMQPGKPTTLQAPFIRPVRSQATLRKQSLTVGMGTIASHYMQMTVTTFIIPWGRYRYKTAPQGYIASGDGYSRRFDEIVSHVPNKTKCVDDTLLWEVNLHKSFFQASTGWTCAVITVSPLTLRNLYLVLTQWNSQASR